VKTDETQLVTCPYCGEEIEIYVELDVRGSYVQDCEVCCNPWTISVSRDGDELFVEVSRADGTD
jgi:cysteine-rich CPXCG protein